MVVLQEGKRGVEAEKEEEKEEKEIERKKIVEKAATWAASFGSRDASIRVVQYGTRAIRGVLQLTQEMESAAGWVPTITWALGKNQTLHIATMEARRTFRWFGSFAILRSLLSGVIPFNPSSSVDVVLYRLSLLGALSWFWIDHVRFFSMIGWIDRSKQVPIRKVSFGLHMLGRFFQFLFYLRIYLQFLHSTQNTPTQMKAVRKSLTKSVLDVVTFAHVSEVWKTHDIFAGVTGASSSLIDLFC